ncbi:MAG: MerR family transcriptional regulator [Clostridia bacterium]|nr:MerR family transcriptional regulator [Clostridia bacterium]
MSKYTTGEMAKLCGVSVRTVQYYDDRGILSPSELSEGGRRLYSETDLKKMKIVCFLRSIDLPIHSIGEIMKEEHPEHIISLLLERQRVSLTQELADRQEKLAKLEELQEALKSMDHISVESIGDVAYLMENKKKLRKMRVKILTVGILAECIEIGTALYWWQTGIWLPFAIGMMVVVACGVWISAYHYQSTMYICPECHTVFRPTFQQDFWAPHTPTTRKLTCPSCRRRGYCVETYGKEERQDG